MIKKIKNKSREYKERTKKYFSDNKDKIKKHLKEVIDLRTSPNEIALGFAVGTAIAILPTFGLGILIGIALIFIFPKINKISMLISFAFWNPLLLIATSALSFTIGNFLFPNLPLVKFRFEILNQIFVYTRKFLIGNLIVTAVFTIVSYFIVYYLVKSYYKRNSMIYEVLRTKVVEAPVVETSNTDAVKS